MRKRDLISFSLLAVAIAWPATARAQQMISPKVPRPVLQLEVAPDLYFRVRLRSSNAGFSRYR